MKITLEEIHNKLAEAWHKLCKDGILKVVDKQKNPLSLKEFEKMVKSIKYKDYRVRFYPIQPDEICPKYRYYAWKFNTPNSGLSGNELRYMIKVNSSRGKGVKFQGFDSFDFRSQPFKKDFIESLKRLDAYILKNTINNL